MIALGLILFLLFVVVPAVGGGLLWVLIFGGIWKVLVFVLGLDKDKI